MKRIIFGLLALLSLCWTADARFPRGTPSATPNANLRQENVFGLTGSAWQDTANYYNPGTGNPAVSTADALYTDGVYWMRPYDLLDSACGSAGAAVATANGRYAWLWSPDHPSGSPQADATGWFVGFSNDPGVFPTTGRQILPYSAVSLAKVADITADISNGSGGAGNVLNVTAVTGYVSFGSVAVVTGTGVTQVQITAQTSGTTGKTGTYTIAGAAQLVTSRSMTVNQQNYYLYMTPYLTCNPDDASNAFYIYGEGSASSVLNETGYVKSNDLVTFSAAVPTHVVYSFGPFSSYQKIVRLGVNNWYSVGFEADFPQNPTVYGQAIWSSTDGVVWNPVTSTSFFNTCIPANTSGPANNLPCNAANAIQTQISASPPRVTIGAQDWVATDNSTRVAGTRVGNQWVSRTAIDAGFNSLASPAPVDISSPYAGNYPGPTYINATNSYLEDGVLHYYANVGYPKGGTPGLGIVPDARYENQGACGAGGSPADGVVGLFKITGQVTGTKLDVLTVVTNSVVVGGMVTGSNVAYNSIITGTTTTTPGFLASYTLSQSSTTSAGITMNGYTCGGLNQQGIDYFTEVVDASAAATAAPIGVKASCAASTASLTWFNALPQQTYRLYRGTTAGSQTTLVGDFTGTTATDTGMSLNALTYYKLVYLHSGVEQKNRVVSTWCSTSVADVNAHMTRAFHGGADMSTCNQTMLDSFDAWLVSNDRKKNLRRATMADFCVAKSGSQITKIFDYGTTYLPRGGDYTPLTANTTYNATGINSKPAWVNTSSAYGYYGGGRYNNIRRYKQITIFAAYQKPGTGKITPFAIGQFSNIMSLSHLSGSPGSIECKLSDATQLNTVTVAVSGLATDVHTAACTFDGTTWLPYSDAVAGSGVAPSLVIPSPKLNPYGILDGQVDSNSGFGSTWRVLMSGSDQGVGQPGGAYNGSGNLADYKGRFQGEFDVALSGAEITSLDALVR